VIEVQNLTKRYGPFTAVDDVSFKAERGEILGFLGPNGAGKTTLFNVLTGFDRATRGAWSFDGHPLAGLPAYRIARLGMIRTFQLTKSLARLTVLDNMLLAAPNQPGERLWRAPLGLWRHQERRNRVRALALLERFNLAAKQHDLAATLSGGQRKLLEMARALMVEPMLVMLDEPMAGVNPALVQSLLDHIRELRDEGRTVVFVEHDMDVVMSISDWVVCLAEGQVIAEGPPASIVANEAVIDAYLGTRHGPRPSAVDPGEVL